MSKELIVGLAALSSARTRRPNPVEPAQPTAAVQPGMGGLQVFGYGALEALDTIQEFLGGDD